MNRRNKLAEELKALAEYITTTVEPNADAEAGIRLAEIKSEWERNNFGLSDDLIASRERTSLALAI